MDKRKGQKAAILDQERESEEIIIPAALMTTDLCHRCSIR